MISRQLRKAYHDLASATRVVMVNDFEYQYALRSEVRRVIRDQLPVMHEPALVEEVLATANMLETSVVQARWSEDTGAHKLIVRPQMLSTTGGTTELSFLTPEEFNARLTGQVADDFEKAVGCKAKAKQN
jgi:hypothetical protein